MTKVFTAMPDWDTDEEDLVKEAAQQEAQDAMQYHDDDDEDEVVVDTKKAPAFAFAKAPVKARQSKSDSEEISFEEDHTQASDQSINISVSDSNKSQRSNMSAEERRYSSDRDKSESSIEIEISAPITTTLRNPTPALAAVSNAAVPVKKPFTPTVPMTTTTNNSSHNNNNNNNNSNKNDNNAFQPSQQPPFSTQQINRNVLAAAPPSQSPMAAPNAQPQQQPQQPPPQQHSFFAPSPPVFAMPVPQQQDGGSMQQSMSYLVSQMQQMQQWQLSVQHQLREAEEQKTKALQKQIDSLQHALLTKEAERLQTDLDMGCARGPSSSRGGFGGPKPAWLDPCDFDSYSSYSAALLKRREQERSVPLGGSPSKKSSSNPLMQRMLGTEGIRLKQRLTGEVTEYDNQQVANQAAQSLFNSRPFQTFSACQQQKWRESLQRVDETDLVQLMVMCLLEKMQGDEQDHSFLNNGGTEEKEKGGEGSSCNVTSQIREMRTEILKKAPQLVAQGNEIDRNIKQTIAVMCAAPDVQRLIVNAVLKNLVKNNSDTY